MSVRQAGGLVVLAVIAAALLLVPVPIGLSAWVALGLGVLLFSLEQTRAVRWLLGRGGSVVVTPLIVLLLLGTGGTDSAFQDLFGLVLVYSAVVRGWRRFSLDTVVVGVAASVPGLVEGSGTSFWVDLGVDLLVWALIGVVAGLLANRLGSARARSEHLRSVIDEVADTVTVLDAATGQVQYANRIVSEIVGVEPDEVVRRRLWELTEVFDEQDVRDLVDELEVGGPSRVLEHTSERTEPPRTWQSSARLVSVDGTDEQLVLIARDVTAQRQIDRAREEALAHERALAEELHRTTVAQRTFLQSVSHEVRTPLTAVRGFAATLQGHGETLSTAMREQLLDRLVVNVSRLEGLLDDLLDVGTSEPPAPSDAWARFALRDVCAAALDRTGVTDEVRALDPDEVLQALPDVELEGDEARIERALASLLRNAFVHTPEGTRVLVRAQVHDDQVTFMVEDDGPGVASSITDTMFAPFVQGPAAHTSPSPGVGVGLALARQAAEMHDGHVWHEPIEPTGSRFCLRLPLVRAVRH